MPFFLFHPRVIFQAWMWDLIEHINQKPLMDSRGHPPQPIKQWFHLMVRHQKTIIRSVSIPSIHNSGAFVPTKAPGLVTQPIVVVGVQSICPTKAQGLVTQPTKGSKAFVQPRAPKRLSNQGYRTSNSTQVVTRLESVCPTKATRTCNSTQAKETWEPTKKEQWK